MIQTRRIYEPADPGDGRRVLIDGLWPRGIAKVDAAIDEWMKGIAPSAELRKWFGHEPQKWPEFEKRYRAELKEASRAALLQELRIWADEGDLTLVFAARDRDRCNGAVLAKLLAEMV